MPAPEARHDAPPLDLIGDRITLEQIAAAIRPPGRPACARTARNLVDRLHIPFVKVAGVRWYERETVRRALLAGEQGGRASAPRRPGRPKKAA